MRNIHISEVYAWILGSQLMSFEVLLYTSISNQSHNNLNCCQTNPNYNSSNDWPLSANYPLLYSPPLLPGNGVLFSDPEEPRDGESWWGLGHSGSLHRQTRSLQDEVQADCRSVVSLNIHSHAVLLHILHKHIYCNIFHCYFCSPAASITGDLVATSCPAHAEILWIYKIFANLYIVRRATQSHACTISLALSLVLNNFFILKILFAFNSSFVIAYFTCSIFQLLCRLWDSLLNLSSTKCDRSVI